jgi:hypothetical protein
MAGSMASTLMFICFLLASVISGFYLLAYAARCLLVVVNGTAAGQDRVTWPDEPIIDWVTQSLALVALVLLWLIPVGFLARALEDVFLPGQRILRTLVLAGPALWLFFPIGSLSSLSSVSRWGFFRPVILGRMLVLFPSTVLFYLISLVLLFLALGSLAVSILHGPPLLLILAAPLSAALFLIYARLLGRLAWRIVQLGPIKASRPAKRPTPRKVAAKPARPRQPEAEGQDPWSVPDPDPEPVIAPGAHRSPTGILDEENQEPYGLADPKQAAQPQPEAPQARQRPLDPEEEDARRGYGMAEGPKKDERKRDRTPRPRARRKGAQRPAKPPGSAFAGVLGFPWYETSMGAWMWLSMGTLIMGLMLVGLIQFMPPV